MTSPDSGQAIEAIVGELRGLGSRIDPIVSRLRQEVGRRESHAGAHSTTSFWVWVAFTDALVRIRLSLQQSFHFIESLGLLAITRYLFELSVWLKLLRKDARYGLVYRHELIKTQQRYYEDLKSQLLREIEFLRNADSRAEALRAERLEQLHSASDDIDPEAIASALSATAQEIDDSAARVFTIYGEQARQNGYSFQAHSVETQVIPAIDRSLQDLRAEAERLEVLLSPDLRELIPKRWKWKQQAELVEMAGEYDFIYTFTSRLLHATPASVTTNQKNLEYEEVLVFLKYCLVRVRDALQMADELLSVGEGAAADAARGCPIDPW